MENVEMQETAGTPKKKLGLNYRGSWVRTLRGFAVMFIIVGAFCLIAGIAVAADPPFHKTVWDGLLPGIGGFLMFILFGIILNAFSRIMEMVLIKKTILSQDYEIIDETPKWDTV